MKEVLQFLAEVTPDILERNISDNELIEIYDSTTEEEVKEYNDTIWSFLDWDTWITYWELRTAVSYFYMTLYLLENNLIC